MFYADRLPRKMFFVVIAVCIIVEIIYMNIYNHTFILFIK